MLVLCLIFPLIKNLKSPQPRRMKHCKKKYANLALKAWLKKLHGKNKLRFLKDRLPVGIRDNTGTFFSSPGLFFTKTNSNFSKKTIFAKLQNNQVKHLSPFGIYIDDDLTINFGNYSFPIKTRLSSPKKQDGARRKGVILSKNLFLL